VSGPTGLRWRLTDGITRRSRAARFDLFMRTMKPATDDRILDVGVTNTDWRDGNFLESRYPWPERITAVSIEPVPAFERNHPSVRLVVADGRQLPFADGEFDIGFSNAVIEHVGSRADQERFVSEMVRTCRRVFICTPNARFPVDPHTLLPFVHWLPRRQRHHVLRLTGNGSWASEEALNPLDGQALRGLFPGFVKVRVLAQRMLLLPSVLVAVGESRAGAGPIPAPHATPTDIPPPSPVQPVPR
jgi:hypothetical protein